MSELRDRNLLYARLEEVLGAEPAGILMKQLPPENTVATRSDIERIEDHLRAHDARFDGIDTRLDGIDTRLDAVDGRFDAIDQRLGRVEQRMDRIDDRMDRLDDHMHDLHGAMREQTRNYIVANAGLMISLTGIAVGAAAVL